MIKTTSSSRCRYFTHYNQSHPDKDCGFTLLEMILSISITGIVITSGLQLWLSAWHTFLHTAYASKQSDDEWILYHALRQDFALAKNIQTDGKSLNVKLEDGQASFYWLSPVTHLILRSLNGSGDVTTSTGVSELQFHSNDGVSLTVYTKYEEEGNDYVSSFTLTPADTAMR